MRSVTVKSTKKADLNEISWSYCRLLKVLYIHGERKEKRALMQNKHLAHPGQCFDCFFVKSTDHTN